MPNAKTMPYRNLGKCGTKVSAFSLGGWTTFGGSVNDQRTIRETIQYAFEQGINFFDIADIYAKGNSEIEMGKVLMTLPRHELVISSKLYWPMSDDINDRGLSRKHIFESIHKSLKRIGTDYLDIYFCHRFDTETPLEETIRAMHDLVTQGKILYWGTSEWTADQINEAHKICEKGNFYKPQVEQPQFSLLVRSKIEREIRPCLEKNGMGMVTWSPLASGVLTGKYTTAKELPIGSRLSQIEWLREGLLTAENLQKAAKLVELGKKVNVKASQLALAWTAAQSGVSSVILGVTRKEQLEENLSTLTSQISHELMRNVDELFR